MGNEVIGVDHLMIKSKSKPEPQTMKIHQIAFQVNQTITKLVDEVARLNTINQQLTKELDELRAQHK